MEKYLNSAALFLVRIKYACGKKNLFKLPQKTILHYI